MSDIRIQDDLYNHVNKEWLDQAVIPEDKPTAGGFADLAKGVEETMLKEFQDMSASKAYPDEYLKKAVTLYSVAVNTEKRNAEGITPVLADLSKIESLADISSFNAQLASLTTDGIPCPFTFSVEEDMMDTSHYCVFITGATVILPDCKYYKPGMEAQKEQFLAAWKHMTEQVMAKTSLSAADQETYIKDALAFDEILAQYVKSMEEWADYVKNYNPVNVADLAAQMDPVDIKGVLDTIFPSAGGTIIVAEPRYFENFKNVLNEETFPLYKHWAYVTVLLSATSCLSEELRDIGSSYRRALSGVAAIPVVEKYAYNLASSYFSEPVGLYYGEKYFGEVAKKDVIQMVQQVVETYKNRIAKNDFLSEATKEKAILKLSTMGLKLAYPDKVDPLFDLLKVDENKSLYEICSELSKTKRLDEFKKAGTTVDRTKWVMPGHVVNACYNPSLNDITFPAAILQAPFYSIKQSRSQNLGGIGAVIAHEISHAFDNNGAKFDENGNLKNWWTEEDNKRFEERTEAMVQEFEGIELPWGTVNGKFIVSENIADNGGMGATLEVMSHTDGADYEEYFKNWARIWCMKAKEEYLKLILSVDVHAPAILRANMQPRNFEEWYKTFDVKETDGMYLAPEKRVTIW